VLLITFILSSKGPSESHGTPIERYEHRKSGEWYEVIEDGKSTISLRLINRRCRLDGPRQGLEALDLQHGFQRGQE